MSNQSLQHNHKQTEYEFLMQLRDGNKKAFSIIFENYHRYFYVLACRYLIKNNLKILKNPPSKKVDL